MALAGACEGMGVQSVSSSPGEGAREQLVWYHRCRRGCVLSVPLNCPRGASESERCWQELDVQMLCLDRTDGTSLMHERQNLM